MILEKNRTDSEIGKQIDNRKKTIRILIILIVLVIVIILLLHGCEDKRRGTVTVPSEIVLHDWNDGTNEDQSFSNGGNNGSYNQNPNKRPTGDKTINGGNGDGIGDEEDTDRPIDIPPGMDEPSGDDKEDDQDNPGTPSDGDEDNPDVKPPQEGGTNPPPGPSADIVTLKPTTGTTIFKPDSEVVDTDELSMVASDMYPGDRITKYYCLRTSAKKAEKIRFYAEPSNDSLDSKLCEVLKIKVTVWKKDKDGNYSISQEIYDGLIKSMQSKVVNDETYLLDIPKGDNELFYEISVYLDTSVGNEYKSKTMKVDFLWQMLG